MPSVILQVVNVLHTHNRVRQTIPSAILWCFCDESTPSNFCKFLDTLRQQNILVNHVPIKTAAYKDFPASHVCLPKGIQSISTMSFEYT